MFSFTLHGLCSLCRKKFKTGDTKVMAGTLMGISGLVVGLAGMEPSSVKSYCSECVKKVFGSEA